MAYAAYAKIQNTNGFFNWHSTKHGLDWTGHSWTGQLDWTVGQDSWTGQLDWTIGLEFFFINTCNSMFLKKTKYYF